MEEVHEHEEISSRKFKINGHSYYFCTEQDTGNKYFQCICSNSIGEKCPGFIKMTPNNRIVKKVDHTCSGNYTVDKPSEDNGLEVQEYEERGNRFKINGHDYRFCKVLKTKNKHFRCVHRYSRTKKRCQGSITITPNFQIVTKVEHICIDLLEIDKVQEYEEIGRKFKINGYCYYFRDENTKKNHKTFRCIFSSKKCRAFVTITPNLQIVKKVDHNCDQVCEITPQQSSKTTEKEVSPTLSVSWL
jgi:hypothetical protein